MSLLSQYSFFPNYYSDIFQLISCACFLKFIGINHIYSFVSGFLAKYYLRDLTILLYVAIISSLHCIVFCHATMPQFTYPLQYLQIFGLFPDLISLTFFMSLLHIQISLVHTWVYITKSGLVNVPNVVDTISYTLDPSLRSPTVPVDHSFRNMSSFPY